MRRVHYLADRISRSMRKAIFDTFGRVSKLQSALLRYMFWNLTGDVSDATNTHVQEIDEGLKQAIDDEDNNLILDFKVDQLPSRGICFHLKAHFKHSMLCSKFP